MSITTSSKLALHDGSPVRGPEKSWPEWPIFDDTERSALLEVLESRQWWYGDRVRQFEADFAALQGAQYCVSCTSGTTAAEICLQALGIGPDDEVIIPPFTFIATATSVLRNGATPVFVDVDETWNIDPSQIEAAITPRTKAIMPVHFGGLIADMDAINEIAQKHNLKVVEDACHAWGGKWKGEGTGTLGDCGVFSFQASKNVTAGEGGAIVTNDEDLAKLCRSITHSGRVEGAEWYKHYHVGTNARITEFAAAMLSAQLKRVPEQQALRNRNAAILDEALSSIEGLTPQPSDDRITDRARHIYCLRFNPDLFGCSRGQFIKAAAAEGLPMGAGYPLPVYRQPTFMSDTTSVDYSKVSCPQCEDLCERSATWFRHSILLAAEQDMQDIITIIEKVKSHAASLVD